MRKADYAALAAIIKEQVELPKGAENSAQWVRASQSRLCATRIARNFANKAGLRDEFLKACGIEP
jgi:hypothetical protein